MLSNKTEDRNAIKLRLPGEFWCLVVFQFFANIAIPVIGISVLYHVSNLKDDVSGRLILENEKLTGSLDKVRVELEKINDRFKKNP